MANSFAIAWTVAWQVPLSMGFCRQEYWNGLSFPSPGDLPNPEIKPSFQHCRQILHQLSHQRSPTIYMFTFIKNCQMLKSLYYFHCPCQQMKAPTAPWSHQHLVLFFLFFLSSFIFLNALIFSLLVSHCDFNLQFFNYQWCLINLLVYLLAIHIPFLVKFLFKSFVKFLIRLFTYYWILWVL